MTATFDLIDDAPSPDDIRAAIDRIAVSDVFSRSPQLGAFLRFVAEAVLRGKASRIKAYTIGVEVLRRDTNFDPQLDPIVRVEATRLRRAIERYYAGPGVDDPIVVDLPRGTYVPTFRRREMDVARFPVGQRWRDRLHSRSAMVGLIAAVVLIGGGLLLRDLVPSRGSTVAAVTGGIAPQSSARTLPPGNGMPAIYVEPMRVSGTPPEGGIDADVLLGKINDAFARFDTVNVVHPPRAADAAGAVPRADYKLSGALEYRDGHADAQFRLIDVAEGSVVWSRSFDRLAAADRTVVEDKIVGALAEALLQSYGVIRARDRAKHLVSNAGDPRYRCILEAADSFRTLRLTEHERARSCLESLTSIDPSFAVGYTFLALIYGREHQHGLGSRPGDTPPLDRALRAVRRSIELCPDSARTYVVLMVVLFHRGEVQKAFVAGEKALERNPYDMLGPAEYGGRLVLTGEIEKGMAMLRRAGQYGAIRPAWQHFYMFMGAYLGGDLKEAAYQAGQMTVDNYASVHLARALVAVAADDTERARQAVDRLVELQSGWRVEPRRELAKISPSPLVVTRLARDLTKAGLPGL